MINIDELWESEELSGTYFTEEERSPISAKIKQMQDELVARLNPEINEFADEEKPLTEKEIQAQRRAMRFK